MLLQSTILVTSSSFLSKDWVGSGVNDVRGGGPINPCSSEIPRLCYSQANNTPVAPNPHRKKAQGCPHQPLLPRPHYCLHLPSTPATFPAPLGGLCLCLDHCSPLLSPAILYSRLLGLPLPGSPLLPSHFSLVMVPSVPSSGASEPELPFFHTPEH